MALFSTVLFVIVFIITSFVSTSKSQSVFQDLKMDIKSCQTNFSASTSIENFYLECSIQLIYVVGGTAQCHNFSRNALIVESSPSVLNTSFVCVSNRPIFSKLDFEFGVPIRPLLRFTWQRMYTDYNDPLTYSYQITINPPSNALTSIKMTSAKYNFYNMQYPDQKIQVLWHFSRVLEEDDPDYPVSWLGDITISREEFIHTEINANQEMVTIPCVSPHWDSIILQYDRCSFPCPEYEIPIDNMTLFYDPLTGFVLNTTRFNSKGTYNCRFFHNNDNSTGYSKHYFKILDHLNFTTSSQIASLGTETEFVTTPFIHTPYQPDQGRSYLTAINNDTRFSLECSSITENVTIEMEAAGYRKYQDVNATRKHQEKPVQTYIAQFTTPSNITGTWNFVCIDSQTNKSKHRWQTHFGGVTPLPQISLTYDDTRQTIKCFCDDDEALFFLDIRHMECGNIFMCRSLAKCLRDTNYGTPEVNCNKGFGVGTLCDHSPSPYDEEMNETNLELAPRCMSVQPFSKGLVFCTSNSYTLQELYFRGFDGKIYLGNVHPPLEAIIKISGSVTETEPLLAVPSYYTFQCEAHSFYFENGIQWFLAYSDGSSRGISPENVNDGVENNLVQDFFNPRSHVKIYLNDISIVAITCSAPVLSIRDKSSHIEWKNTTLKIQPKFAIAPIFLMNSIIKEIRIGDENQGPKCQVEGFPQPIIKWFRNDNLLTNSKEDVTKRSSLEYLVENFLLIPKYNENDAGEYRCVATNMMGTAELSFIVRTEEIKNTNNTLIIVVPIVAVIVVAAVVAFHFISYKMKIKAVRREKMKEIIEILKGDNTRNSSSVEEPLNPLNIPYNADFELKRHSFCIDESKILGFGEFGAVFQGKLTNVEIDVAFKKNNTANDLRQLKALTSELKILQYIGKHDNIIQLLGAYTQDIERGNLYMAIELCGLGSMLSYLKANRGRFLACPMLNTGLRRRIRREPVDLGETTFSPNHSIKTLLKWSAEIANAMDYLGSKKVVHSDLAARNVLLTVDFVVKITDFGLSEKIYSNNQYVKKGRDDLMPWRWSAIESLQNSKFSVESDAWAFGVVLWEMFSFGDVPYPGINKAADLITELLESEINPNPRPNYASLPLYEVMLKCWNLNPEKRPAFKSLKLLFENAVGRDNYEIDLKDLEVVAEIQDNEIIYIQLVEEDDVAN